MLDLYYWPTVNARKITIALAEMDLPYNIVTVDFTRGQAKTPEFLKINPNGKIPALVDHDPIGGGKPQVLFESVVMMAYLAEKSGKYGSTATTRRYDVMKWLVWQAANVGPMFGQLAHFHDYAEAEHRYSLNRYLAETERLYKLLDNRFGESSYLAGDDYTIADMATWPWIMPDRQEQKLDNYPNLKRWQETVAARPGVVKGNNIRRDLQKPGAVKLDAEQRHSLYGWQQEGR